MIAHANPVELDAQSTTWLNEHRDVLRKPTLEDTRIFKTFEDFVQLCGERLRWSDDEARRHLSIRLEQVKLKPRHLEIYLNYPAYTMDELAKIYGISRDTIRTALARARRKLPALRNDPTVYTDTLHTPALTHMISLDAIPDYEDWMLDDGVIRF